MALGKDRTRIHVRGLGDLELMLKEPTVDTEASNAGYVKSVDMQIVPEMEDIQVDNGDIVDYLMKSRRFGMTLNLAQSSKDEVDLVANASGKVYGGRYFGMVSDSGRFQYFAFDALKLAPEVRAAFSPGHRVLPVPAVALTPDNTFATPPMYVVEALGELRVKNLHLFLAARNGHVSGTVNALDMSGWGRHGVLSSGYASIWQTASGLTFLRFNGSSDYGDFGNVCNLAATDSYAIEAWVRPQAADASLIRFLAKKSTNLVGTAGWMLTRNTSNKIEFLVSNGTTQYSVATSTSCLQNVWKHILIAVPKNGNAQAYLNGTADGSTTAIAASHDATNALSLFLGKDGGGTFGQSDIQGLRVYNFGSAGVPSDIATIASNHWLAEKGYHGL